MTSDQILLLFFGLPLAILGMGMRRALGGRAVLLLLLTATGVALYAVVLESVLRASGHGLPVPIRSAGGSAASVFKLSVGGVLLGILGAVLIRFRGYGAEELHEPAPGQDPPDEGGERRPE